jgi:hypothetical protein
MASVLSRGDAEGPRRLLAQFTQSRQFDIHLVELGSHSQEQALTGLSRGNTGRGVA